MATNVCTALKTATMTELVCQISRLVLLCQVIVPPPPNAAVSAPVKEKSLEDGTINSIIVLGVAFAVSVLNVTPERQLQPPGQLREDAI